MPCPSSLHENTETGVSSNFYFIFEYAPNNVVLSWVVMGSSSEGSSSRCTVTFGIQNFVEPHIMREAEPAHTYCVDWIELSLQFCVPLCVICGNLCARLRLRIEEQAGPCSSEHRTPASMTATVMFSSRFRNSSSTARTHVLSACKKKDGTDIGKGIALPGGGFWLPNPKLVEAGFLYGPGHLGFAMFKHGADSNTRPLKLVPYHAGDPPVCTGEDGKPISIDLAEGTIYEVDAETVDEDDFIDLKLLSAGNIAGMLPPAPADAEAVVCFFFLLFTWPLYSLVP
jgi:hypothetical protein